MNCLIILGLLILAFVAMVTVENFHRGHRHRRYMRHRGHPYRHHYYTHPHHMSFWSYLNPGYYYNYLPYTSNPGCDGKTCGGYCTPYNSTCCGGTNPSTCAYPRCKGHSSCS